MTAWQTTKMGYCASSSQEILVVQHSSFDIQASCDVPNFFSHLPLSEHVHACPPLSPKGPVKTQNRSFIIQSISALSVRLLLLDLTRKVLPFTPMEVIV